MTIKQMTLLPNRYLGILFNGKSDNSEGKIVKMFISTVIKSFGGFVFNSENMHKTYIICPDVSSKKELILTLICNECKRYFRDLVQHSLQSFLVYLGIIL